MTGNSKKERKKEKEGGKERVAMRLSALSIGDTNKPGTSIHMSVLIIYLFSTGSKELSGSVGLHDDRVSLLVIFLENIICRLDCVLRKNVDPIGKAQGVLHRRDRAYSSTRTQLIREKKKVPVQLVRANAQKTSRSFQSFSSEAYLMTSFEKRKTIPFMKQQIKKEETFG